MTSSPPVRSFDWRNLGVRALSAAVMAPVALGAVWVGGWLLLLVIAAALAVLSLEWGRMCAPESRTRSGSLVLVGALAGLLALYAGYPHAGWAVLGLAALLTALVARLTRLSRRPMDTAFGVIYLGAPAMALFWLRGSEGEGRTYAFLLLAIAWAADSVAFLAGSVLKGPKLWPRFSPNKTWSGFFAGLVAAVAAAVVGATLLRPYGAPTLKLAAAMGLLAGLATMGGDLFESMLKRRFGVKDSGDLIPGHGGLLDRVDGLLMAVLVVAGARVLAHTGLFR